MIAAILVVIIIAGCAVYQYLKGTALRAFAMFIGSIFAAILAFNYYELLAQTLSGVEFIAGRFDKVGNVWLFQTIAFLLVFSLVFVILLTVSEQLTRKKIDLGFWQERIAKILFGALAGIIISGSVVLALRLSPAGAGVKYVPLNTDQIVTNIFSHASIVSLSSNKSFAVVHANFLENIPYVKGKDETLSIKNEIKTAKFYPAPPNIQLKESPDQQPQSITSSRDENVIIVQVEFVKNTPRSDLKPLDKIRLICKSQQDTDESFAGRANNFHPIGLISDGIVLKYPFAAQDEPKEEEKEKPRNRRNRRNNTKEEQQKISTYEFAFKLPNDQKPIALAFNRYSLIELTKLRPEKTEN